MKHIFSNTFGLKNNKSLVLICLAFFALGTLNGCKTEQQPLTAAEKIELKVDSLLKLMTLDEKVGQMCQVRHFDDIKDGDVKNKFIGSVIHTDGPTPGTTVAQWQAKFIELQKEALSTRLGIPLLLGVDAIHGQNTFDGATIFPHNIGLGATGNVELVEKIAHATALEVQATGLNWTFSPCLAIPYNEKWGRVYEAFSENKEVVAEMGAASVKGYQGAFEYGKSVLATAKHYIGDGSTDFGVEGGETSMTSNDVYEQLILPYQAAVDANVGAIMASFNTLSGMSMHAHKELITDSLKGAMGFSGMVITDWKGYSRFGRNDIINAGVDMVMAVDGDLDVFIEGVKEGVESGEVPITRIDDAVSRILRQKFRLGIFKNPLPNENMQQYLGADEHRALAKQAVRESMVLLKNENNVLPIAKEAQKIVVVGEHANNAGLQSGGWTIKWQGRAENYNGATTILDGINSLAQGEVVYDTTAQNPQLDADVAIIVIGEKPYAEFMGDIGKEGYDCDYEITDAHKAYIDAYAGKVEKLVIILISGRPLVVTEQIEQSDAYVAAWLPGSEGDGIAEVLFGDYNFTGTLPHSWPKSVGDFKGKYGPNFWDKSITPLFEYGYGLKY